MYYNSVCIRRGACLATTGVMGIATRPAAEIEFHPNRARIHGKHTAVSLLDCDPTWRRFFCR